jgi:2-polyprenyl-3-methyl-5-hydroxy-6-metoxy-1,4-benzoquinol methylase
MSINCPICEKNHCSEVYSSRGSSIRLTIIYCNNCRHVFAQRDKKTKKPSGTQDIKITRVSCDADYSEVRVGKQQMTDRDFDRLMDFLADNQSFSPSNILDSCAARGHFIDKLDMSGIFAEISAIEPDEYMAMNYKNKAHFKTFIGEISNFVSENKYDIIYSCHSLEHYHKPNKVFEFIEKNLESEGIFFVNVPNLEWLENYNAYDEYFYDYHLQYFTQNSLFSLAARYGYRPIRLYKDSSLAVMFTKSPNRFESHGINDSDYDPLLAIMKYSALSEQNTIQAPIISLKINRLIKNISGPIVFFGAGRVLDYFIEYGKLSIASEQIMLVDNFLRNGTDELYGKKLLNLSELDASSISAWFVFSNTASTNISDLIKSRSEAPIFFPQDFCGA